MLLAAWLPLVRHDRVVEAPARPVRARHLAGLAPVWPLVACFGLVSAQAYSQLGWYPAILIDAGLSGRQAATAFAVLTAVGVPTILTLPALTRVLGDRGTIIGFAAATTAGWIGLLVSPSDLTSLWSAPGLLVATGAAIGLAGVLTARPWSVEDLLEMSGGSSGDPNSYVGPARAGR